MEKVLMALLLIFVLVVTAMWLYIGSINSDLERAKYDLRNAQNKIISNEKKCDTDLKFCEQMVQIEKTKTEIEKTTKTEIKDKQSKGGDYEILASKNKTNECGCTHDGIGWVFK
jgi:predicted Holliday junction resolvase-like endonuclease